jgi:hypothetical protein
LELLGVPKKGTPPANFASFRQKFFFDNCHLHPILSKKNFTKEKNQKKKGENPSLWSGFSAFII